MAKRKHRLIVIFRSGILLVLAGLLFFFEPKTWIAMGSPLLKIASAKKQGEEGLLWLSMKYHIPFYEYSGCEDVENITLQSNIGEIAMESQDKKRELLNNEMMVENKAAQEKMESSSEVEANVAKPKPEPESQSKTESQIEIDAEVEAESQVAKKKEKKKDFDRETYSNFDALLKDYYVVDNTTYIDEEELNVEKLLNYDLSINKSKGGPQILIYHTHSQEGYADSVPGDQSTSVIGAGEKLAQILEEEYGFSVLHHRGEYDVESRDYAYANAAPHLEQILKEYPTIEVVIDLHRDGVAEGTHLLTELDGQQTAQLMFFNGLSRLKSTGEIEYLSNPNREGNLAFSFQLQVKCEEYYPGLARSIYLKGYRYNMQYKERSLLVELGAQTNTVQEIHNALSPLAHVISMVLEGE